MEGVFTICFFKDFFTFPKTKEDYTLWKIIAVLSNPPTLRFYVLGFVLSV